MVVLHTHMHKLNQMKLNLVQDLLCHSARKWSGFILQLLMQQINKATHPATAAQCNVESIQMILMTVEDLLQECFHKLSHVLGVRLMSQSCLETLGDWFQFFLIVPSCKLHTLKPQNM